MIAIKDLKIQFGERTLFDGVSFLINPNDKIGLIGKNGVGKTTLFKLIMGDMTPDKGTLEMNKEVSVALLSQYLPTNKENSIINETLTACKDYYELKTKITRLETELYSNPEIEIDEKKAAKLVDLQERLYSGAIDNPEAKAEQILMGLGFKREQLDSEISSLSGGWQMRIELAKLLLQEPDLLLLDEPTNHLDIDAIIWFEKYILKYPKAVMLISHDEAFLSNCSNRIIELVNAKAYDFKGTLKRYNEEKEIRLIQNKSAFENQQKVLAQKQKTINRFMAKATKTKMAQSMQKQVDKIEKVELETFSGKKMNVNFPYSIKPGKIAFTAKNIHKSYGDNHVIRGADLVIESGSKVAFVGQNGQGKTTLLKILSEKLTIDQGEVIPGHNIQYSYYDQEQADVLDSKLTILETVEARAHADYRTKVRKVLGAFMFSGEDVEKKVSVLSGGERARVALACMVVQPTNCLILDEPTNHLDMESKHLLKQAVMDYEGTVLLVSHDRAFLDGISERTIEFRDYQLKDHIGDINAVLAKREESSLREISLKAESKKKVKQEVKATVDHKALKEQQKKVRYLERDIEKLEEKIKSCGLEMGKPEFYTSPDADEKIKQYAALKSELETKMETWENLVESIE